MATPGGSGAPFFARYTASGTLVGTVALSENQFPSATVMGPDGAIWMATGADLIARVSATGDVTRYYTPNEDAHTVDITLGGDGALWFTESINGNGESSAVGASRPRAQLPNIRFRAGFFFRNKSPDRTALRVAATRNFGSLRNPVR